jgi:hypothetical protein
MELKEGYITNSKVSNKEIWGIFNFLFVKICFVTDLAV